MHTFQLSLNNYTKKILVNLSMLILFLVKVYQLKLVLLKHYKTGNCFARILSLHTSHISFTMSSGGVGDK
jgi:hypothetical protein